MECGTERTQPLEAAEEKLVESHENDFCAFAELPEPPPIPEMEPQLLTLLPPDHPLMIKFQQNLKAHLLKSKEQLAIEIIEIKDQIKFKEREREEEGAKLFDMQEDLRIQNEQLEEYTLEIQKHMELRQKEEEALAELKLEYEKISNMTKEQKILYNKRMVELEHINQLENTIQTWTLEMEDEVKTSKRILNRDVQLQKQLSEDKKKSDMLFLHINTEVKKREKELEVLQDEIKKMHDVINILNSSISLANTDLEVLQNEHKHLTQAWSEVIVSISHRDKILLQVRNDVNKKKEFIKMSSLSIEAVKKQIVKELKQTEELETFKARITNDCLTLKGALQKEADALAEIEKKLNEIPLWLEQTAKDLQIAKREGTAHGSDIIHIQRKIDKEYNKKFEIEEYILKMAEEQLLSDKASVYRMKLLRNLQKKRRHLELTLAQSQNQLAATLLDLEKCKGRLIKLQKEDEVVSVQLTEAEKQFDDVYAQLNHIEFELESKLKHINKLSIELGELLRTTDGIEISPIELKIKILEKKIQDAELQIREHQQFWLMLQNHYVHLFQKRNSQLNEIQITYKQLAIIKQKTLKVDYDLEKSNSTTKELERDIQVFRSKIDLLNSKIFKKRAEHDAEEGDCELEHVSLMDRLKVNEMEVLQMEAEIDDLQVDIEHYKDLVLDKHREALSWETKYKLIEETLNWRKQENRKDGDIGTMKAEIHRMQIRHEQLKRAQAHLMTDLEHCIMHRDQLFNSVTIKQRMDTKSLRTKSQVSAGQKVKDLRNKLKQVQSEISHLTDEQLVAMTREQELIHNDILKLRADIERESTQHDFICTEIEENVLLKHLNLETIVHKQNRAKAYRKLKITGKPPKNIRSETTMGLQMQKQIEINDHLVDLVQMLIGEFPDKKVFLVKLLQILKE